VRWWLAASLVALAGAAASEPAGERERALLNTLRHDCGACHGLTLKGGLGPPLVPSALAERTDRELVGIILDGVPGTPMPPWSPILSASEAAWLVAHLKQGL
jgi:cytochrome c55X